MSWDLSVARADSEAVPSTTEISLRSPRRADVMRQYPAFSV